MDSIDETAPPQRSPLARPLPFADETALPQRSPLARPLPFADETAPPQRSPLAAALPFRRAAQPPGATSDEAPLFGLSLERYAALCAEVAVFPEHMEATFLRHGLASHDDRIAADTAWQDRLRADPALMQRWQSLYLHYHERLHLTGQV